VIPEWVRGGQHLCKLSGVDGQNRFWCRGPTQRNTIGYTKSRSHSHDAVIRVYDEAGEVIETHEHAGDFKECERNKTKSRHAVKRDGWLLGSISLLIIQHGLLFSFTEFLFVVRLEVMIIDFDG
jgi:hypothetical protein